MLVVILMVMTVDILLLYASSQFLGGKTPVIRIFGGTLFGTAFTVLSLIPDLQFLDHFLWRLCGLGLTALVSFGLAPGKIFLFVLLHLSLGGISGNQTASTLLGAAGIGFACIAVGRGQRFIPVELTYRGRTLRMTALRDTGNTLRDPVTGRPVLIVGADIAQRLTGLTEISLQDPVKTMEEYPGLRLIPYKTVGSTGFLLALQIPQAKVGNKNGSVLVAFSPNLFGSKYQALTGGTV